MESSSSSPLPFSSSFSCLSSSPVVNKLWECLCQNPTTFEITILPTPVDVDVASPFAEDDGNDDDGDTVDRTSTTAESSSLSSSKKKKKKRGKAKVKLSLDQSLMMVENHLGFDGRSLPWMTQEIREEYYIHRSRTNVLKNSNKDGRRDDNRSTIILLLFQITSCLLLVNPDHATVWADRRRCLIQLINEKEKEETEDTCLLVWKQELNFINLVMTQHSKAPSSWGHRKYVLQQVLKSKSKSASELETTAQEIIESTLRQEIQLCTNVAESYPKNYYAWTHRRYLWTVLLSDEEVKDSPKNLNIIPLLEEEFVLMVQWLERHVSDHSAAHYGGQILHLWLKQVVILTNTDSNNHNEKQSNNKIRTIIELALQKSRQLCGSNSTKYHYDYETPWIFRRILTTTLIEFCSSCQQQQQYNDDEETMIIELIQKEMEFVYQEVMASTTKEEREEDEGGNVTAVVVYPWTFLAWCIVQLREYDDRHSQGTSNDVNASIVTVESDVILSFLEHDHSKIAHLMWKKHGSIILH